MNPNEIFHALVEEGVEYVLIGGLAATAHGVSLVTQDTDICFRQNSENCHRLVRAISRLGAEIFPVRQVTIPISVELLQTHKLVHLRTRAGRLDLIAEVPGLGTYDDLIEETIRIRLDDMTIAVLSVDQLIQAKSALDQPKNREHLDQLLAIRDLRGEQKDPNG